MKSKIDGHESPAGVALPLDDLPHELVEQYGLRCRVHDRNGVLEVRLLHRAATRLLPVLHCGRASVARWGNRRGKGKHLPCTGWTWKETVAAGRWADLEPEPVVIPAAWAVDRGVWYAVESGIRALLVKDERGAEVAYMVCEPASPYYKTMTGSEWMPALVDQQGLP